MNFSLGSKPSPINFLPYKQKKNSDVLAPEFSKENNMENIFNGKRRKRFCVRSEKHSVTTIVFLKHKTVVITVDKDGNIKTSDEPP